MLVRFLRGPKKGKTGHLPSSQEVAALIALGDLEVVDPREAAELEQPAPGQPSRHHTIPPTHAAGYGLECFGPSARCHFVKYDGCGGKFIWEQGKFPADAPQNLIDEFLRRQPFTEEQRAEALLQRKVKLQGEIEAQNRLTIG